MISGLVGGSYEEKLAEIGLTTLEQRRVRGDMIQTWKIVHRADDVDRSIWFRMTAGEEAVHRTRLVGDQTKVVKPSTKYKLRENFYSIRICDGWNNIPREVREAKSIDSFKNMYDEWLESGRN